MLPDILKFLGETVRNVDETLHLDIDNLRGDYGEAPNSILIFLSILVLVIK